MENLIILIVKHYISNSKLTCKLNIETLKKIISNRIVVEKLLLLKNCRLINLKDTGTKFMTNWLWNENTTTSLIYGQLKYYLKFTRYIWHQIIN